ncbi:potassium channel family protein [Cucumibacter marinus]|uniref:potassium channel family protein n=1 Tax=Cucumibacter marinus TaxID=1121252 RepID=UPI000413E380|nr:potassium channel family protein [Cucumibacter marinus]
MSIIFGIVLAGICVLIHYEALRWLSGHLDRLERIARRRLLVAIAVSFVAHLVEIALFAAAFWLIAATGFGALTGEIDHDFSDYLYFSATSYTTLGVGDITPTDGMRMVAGIEGLTGLVMITWSASFTYLIMRKFWSFDEE